MGAQRANMFTAKNNVKFLKCFAFVDFD